MCSPPTQVLTIRGSGSGVWASAGVGAGVDFGVGFGVGEGVAAGAGVGAGVGGGLAKPSPHRYSTLTSPSW